MPRGGKQNNRLHIVGKQKHRVGFVVKDEIELIQRMLHNHAAQSLVSNPADALYLILQQQTCIYSNFQIVSSIIILQNYKKVRFFSTKVYNKTIISTFAGKIRATRVFPVQIREDTATTNSFPRAKITLIHIRTYNSTITR